MRLISWFDWAQFVESVSLVDEVLRERSAFEEMDFATRDRYRHAWRLCGAPAYRGRGRP
jgi:cyclic beta-1,2-glucan synthetase